MTTPLKAIERAMETGSNPTEVLARLGEQGFVVVNQEALTRYAATVISALPGVAQSQSEPIARTVVYSAIMGASLEGMMGDG